MEILLFGIAREIVGSSSLSIPKGVQLKDVAALRGWLHDRYPEFKGLSSLAVAVNKEYADDNHALDAGAEIALIPPVSGG